MKYDEIKKDVDIERNMIDPFKLLFDLYGNDISELQWIEQEKIRIVDKSINNKIGYFHQKLLGSVRGWINIDDDEEMKKNMVLIFTMKIKQYLSN